MHSKKRRGVYILVCFLLILFFLFSRYFFVIIGTGETGVQSFFGSIRDEELSSGLHAKHPLVRVIPMSIRTESMAISASVLARESIPLGLNVTLLYHLEEDKASDIYRDIGSEYVKRVIGPELEGALRDVVAGYGVADVSTGKREEVAQKIQETLASHLDPRGIEVETVILADVILPESLSKTLQETADAVLEKDRYDAVLQTTQKEVERQRLEAEGERDRARIVNQTLSPLYLHYLYIQNLHDREGTIYVPTDPNTGVPLFRGI